MFVCIGYANVYVYAAGVYAQLKAQIPQKDTDCPVLSLFRSFPCKHGLPLNLDLCWQPAC